MTGDAAPQSADQIKDDLRGEFPEWSIILSDKGRWWATRGPLVREHLNERECVDADTPEDLRAQLHSLTAGAR